MLNNQIRIFLRQTNVEKIKTLFNMMQQFPDLFKINSLEEVLDHMSVEIIDLTKESDWPAWPAAPGEVIMIDLTEDTEPEEYAESKVSLYHPINIV